MMIRLFAIGLLTVAALQSQPAGSVQFNAFAGVNAGKNRNTTLQPSLGGGLHYSITQAFAVTGNYGYNKLGSADETVCTLGTCTQIKANAKYQEVLFGGRFNLPTGTRAIPFVSGLGGLVNAAMRASVGNIVSVNVSQTKPAFGVGGGLDVLLTKDIGIMTEFRFVKPSDFTSYVRASAGVFFRLGGGKG